MSATAAQSGYFTTLQLSDGGGTPVFTTIAEISSISGPNLSRSIVDATHMQSDDGAKEFIGGLIDGTTFTCELNFVPTDATQADLLTQIAAAAPVARTYRIVLPNQAGAKTFTASTTTFSATAHGFNTAQPVQFSSSGTLYTGLTVGKFYFAKRTASGTFTVHLTTADAIAGSNAISVSGGSGTHTVYTGTTQTFTALVENLSPKYPLDDKISATVTFKVTNSMTASNLT